MKIPKDDGTAKRCIICGVLLDDRRRRYCYKCLPRGAKNPVAWGIKPVEDQSDEVNPMKDDSYSIADIVALAESYGLSYGRYVAILNDPDSTLPPRIRPVKWPVKSKHRKE